MGFFSALYLLGANAQFPGTFAATAEVDDDVQYLNDSTGKTFTFTVNNTGTTDSIGAVSIRRPSNFWTVTGCPQAPVGWTATLSDVRCQYRSAVGPIDDILPGASSSDFKLTATTRGGSTNRSGDWQVVVSRDNNFSTGNTMNASPTGKGLDITAYVWEVTDAVVADAAQPADTACPPSNKSAFASANHVMVICGRNHADSALTPTAAHSSLGGTFVGSASGFTSGTVAARSTSDVVLGNWNVTVMASHGTNKTVEVVIGSAADQTSPLTKLEGYEAIRPTEPPVAEDDSYDVAGNIFIEHDADTGVTANDFLDTATVSSVDDTGTNGDVAVDPDGSFTFNPDPGFDGATSFDYTVTNSAGSSTATVTLTVSAPNVWFVDNEATTSGDGRFASPFSSLTDFNAIQGDGGPNDPEAGDIVFLYEGSGSYGGGIDLLAFQKLIGQGVDLTYPTALPDGSPSLPTATAKPTVANAAGDGVALGIGNAVRGLEIGAVSGTKLTGASFGTATIDAVSASGPGAILDLDTGTLDMTFDSLASTTSSGVAVDVSNVSGTLGVTGATSVSGAAGDGIVLTGSPSADFDFSKVDVATTAGRGLVASNAGSLGISDATSTITAAGGAALNVSSTSLGTGLTFLSLDSTGGATGVNLDSTGPLHVTGSGLPGSGGTIQNTTGDGVSLANASSVALDFMNIDTSGQDGVGLANVADFDMTGTVIDGSARHGVDGAGVSGVDFTDAQILGAGDAANEHALQMTNWGGTATLSGVVLDGATTDLVNIANHNTNLTLDVDASEFRNASGSFGDDAIDVSPGGSSGVSIDVETSLFRNLKGHSLVLFGPTGASGASDVRFVDNDVDQTTPGHGGSVLIAGRASTTTDLDVTDNVFTDVGGNGLVNVDAGDSATVSGTIARNAITNAPAPGIVVTVDDSGDSTVVVDDNDITNSGSDGIQIANFGGPGTSNLDVVVTNNNVNGHNTSSSTFFIAGIDVFGFEDNTCLALTNNSVLGTPLGFDSYYVEEIDGDMRMEEVPDTPATKADAAFVALQGNLGDGPTTVLGDIDLTNGASCARP